MPPESLQLLIRQKLANGTLPMNSSVPRIWGGPGNGETCEACDGVITKDEWVSEGVSLAGGPKPVHLHVKCFHLWQEERQAMSRAQSSDRALAPAVSRAPTPRSPGR